MPAKPHGKASECVCEIDGCENKRGRSNSNLCPKHKAIELRQRYADSGVKCRLSGCELPIDSKKHLLCQKHLAKLYRYGDPEAKVGTPDGEPLAYAKIIALSMPLPDTCILWPYSYDAYGYGSIHVGDKKIAKAHRVVLAIHQGMSELELPHRSIVTRHLCPNGPNRLCVNPRHLKFGTTRENMDDVKLHLSQAGEKNPGSKLTEAQVIRILVDGEEPELLAKELNIKKDHVGRIRRRERWGHVVV